ncbi:hypothetical protein WMF37_48000 [Sorangium sp. So ce291]|uniref:hypothetical protein n=1 Tax=Sorangium sp. So ce291 TaxID=3133294 RepID=UPI003F5FFC02
MDLRHGAGIYHDRPSVLPARGPPASRRAARRRPGEPPHPPGALALLAFEEEGDPANRARNAA